MKMDALEDIKKNLGKEKMIIGFNETLKNLKPGKIDKVFLASNTEASTKEDLEYYCGLNETPLTVLNIPNDELGIVCKKQFPISVISLLK